MGPDTVKEGMSFQEVLSIIGEDNLAESKISIADDLDCWCYTFGRDDVWVCVLGFDDKNIVRKISNMCFR